MGRILKWLLYAVGLIATLIAVFVLIVVLVVDPNDYRGEIEQAVQERTGRELTIEGDLGLTFFPWFGIEVGETRLAEAEGFGDEPFVEVGRAQLAVRVWPLLAGDLELDTVILERPRIRLVRLADGRANWETLAPAGEEAEDEAAETGSGEAGGVPEILHDARLAGLRISDAHVTYEDREADLAATLEPFNLTLEDVRLGAPVPLAAEWQARLNDGPTVDGSLKAVLEISDDLASARANGIDLSLTASGEGIPAGSQEVRIGGDLEADLRERLYRLSGLSVTAAGAELAGEFEARLTDAGPNASGRLALAEVSPREIFEALAIDAPRTRDEDALRALEAETELRYVEGRLTLENVSARLDDSDLEGRVTVRDFAGPAADFAFNVDEIDVDRYLPPAGEEPAEPGDGEGDGEDTDGGEGGGELPMEPLRSLELNGQIQIGALTIAGARASDINLSITARDGRIRVHPLTALLYDGQYSGDIQLDATGDVPAVSVNESLSGIQAEPLLADLAGFERLLGTGDFSIDVSARGADLDSILEALTGEARFSFADGAVKGINVARTLRRGLATVRGESAPEEEADPQTDFTALGGTLTFDGGRVRNDDLDMRTPLLRVGGEGEANLLQRSLDYRLTVNVVDTLEGQQGEDLEELRRIPVPLRITGSFADPEIELAVGEAMREALGQRAEERLREEAEDARGEIEERVKDRLEGLFR